MKRSGFTLIELIFVIVIIGVLAAVAVPKFKNLKVNAETSNIIQPLADLNSSGGASSYLNAVELGGISKTDLNITNIYKFTGKGWTVAANGKSATYDVGDFNATYTYSDGNVTIVIKCDTGTTNGAAAKVALGAKNYDCSTTGTTYYINLESQE